MIYYTTRELWPITETEMNDNSKDGQKEAQSWYRQVTRQVDGTSLAERSREVHATSVEGLRRWLLIAPSSLRTP